MSIKVRIDAPLEHEPNLGVLELPQIPITGDHIRWPNGQIVRVNYAGYFVKPEDGVEVVLNVQLIRKAGT